MLRIAALVALAGCSGLEKAPKRAVELVDAPATIDVATEVKLELARSAGKRLVVYVGAAWCEPCRHFHDAAVRGDLDLQFGDARFLVFDRDRDGAALEAAGYKSVYIPLFVIPNADGTASAHHVEGSIKGDGAVPQIAPRLRALLDEPNLSP